MTKKAVLWTAVGLGLAAMLLALALSSGWRIFAVQTPSMGQTAPVGTLVVTHAESSYQVGDIISFQRGERVYTHRIVALTDNGEFTTKGDLNGSADPLSVPVANVIGSSVLILPGLGWVLMGLPWLVLAAFAIVLLTSFNHWAADHRWAVRIVGITVSLTLIMLWLRPWINLSMLGFTPADSGGVLMHVVNTGLFPVDAAGTVLVSGQDAVVQITQQDASGHFVLTPIPALSLNQHVVLILASLIPLIAAFFIRVEQDHDDPDRQPDRGTTRTRRLIVVLAISLSVVTVSAVQLSSSWAAYAATIQNTKDTTGTRTFFSCSNAVTSLSQTNTYLAFAMNPKYSIWSGYTETDLSGNSHTGTYAATPTVSTSHGCDRDTPTTSVTFNGTSQCVTLPSRTTTSTPNTFSLEAWFRTTTKANGKLVGFNSSRTGVGDSQYDRHVYLDTSGRVVFGVYPTQVKTVYTTDGKNYADGSWHHVVATLSAAGQFLYVDGGLAMSDTSVTSAQTFAGYWKIGCGNLDGWRNGGSTSNDLSGPKYFKGDLQYVAIYNAALSATQAQEHYLAGAS
jgi:signal peptidase I